MLVDNFRGHICNIFCLVVNIHENQEYRKGQNITQPTDPTRQLAPSVLAGVGLSLDPEGREKGSQAGEFIGKKKI